MSTCGKQKRSLNAKYYNELKWLEYSISKDTVFCFYCRILLGCSIADHVFTKSGFTNWKRVNIHF